MLTKRTNILFSEAVWDRLVLTARENSTSVGELVRNAVVEKYILGSDVQRESKRQAVLAIKEIRKNIRHQFSHKEIQSLIHHGHRY